MPTRRQNDSHNGQLVETADAFDDVCSQLSEHDIFAFDAEFVGEDAYSSEACLIQVASRDDVWLIDPLAGFDVKPFWRLVSDEKITKVVHAGFEDLAISFMQTGEVPRNIFDTQIAAGIAGMDYPLSLLRLVRAITGARLHKSQTLTDWRRRPLSPEQIRYGAEDVAHLLAVRANIQERLESANRVDWAQEEFERFTKRETYQSDVKELYHRVKGIGSLDRKALSIVRELAIEREKIAKKFNRPPRVLLKDYLVLEIAKHALVRSEDLKSLRGFSLRGEALKSAIAAVQRGLDTPPDQRPPKQEVNDDTKEEQAIRKLLSAVLDDYCRTQGLALQLVATNRDVRALVLSHTRPGNNNTSGALQRGWRKQAIGGLLDDVLSGRRAVRVASDKKGFRLDIG